ncbi:MAG: exodeoxyribonuclease III, partial [Treponema sp.]|nr:exodeoxyribonuclease III [Treponema sp.]
PEERAWMDFFTSNGFTDTFRMFNQDPGQYSWWSYRMHAREKNVGWRIDYLCVNDGFKSHVKSSTIMSDVMGSDHCPVCIEID